MENNVKTGRQWKRLLSILMAIAMAVVLLPMSEMTVKADDGTATVNKYTIFVPEDQTAPETDGSTTVTEITESTTSLDNDGWYVVSGNVTLSNRLNFAESNYNYNIILLDGATLTCQGGMYDNYGNSITFWSGIEGTGTIKSTGSCVISGDGSSGDGEATLQIWYVKLILNGGKLTINSEGTISAVENDCSDGIVVNAGSLKISNSNGPALNSDITVSGGSAELSGAGSCVVDGDVCVTAGQITLIASGSSTKAVTGIFEVTEANISVTESDNTDGTSATAVTVDSSTNIASLKDSSKYVNAKEAPSKTAYDSDITISWKAGYTPKAGDTVATVKNNVIVNDSENLQIAAATVCDTDYREIDSETKLVEGKKYYLAVLVILKDSSTQKFSSTMTSGLALYNGNVSVLGTTVTNAPIGDYDSEDIEIDGDSHTRDDALVTAAYDFTSAGSFVATEATVSVTGLSLNKTTASLTVGKTETLVATVTPTNATNKALTWTSSNTKVATVNSNGKVTAVAAGTAKITATSKDSGKTATCTVTVTSASDEINNNGKTPTIDSKYLDTKYQQVSEAKYTKNGLQLNSGLKISQTGSKITVKWSKVTGAAGYDVYVGYCGKTFKLAKSTKSASVTITKIDGKKIDTKKNFKIYVSAYTKVSGKKVIMARSIIGHIVGAKNTKYSNPNKVTIVNTKTIKSGKATLKKGASTTIKAKVTLVNKKRKSLSDAHASTFRYATSNSKVATVTKTGKIKAVGKGKCIIYVYAKNGYAAKVTVTVK